MPLTSKLRADYIELINQQLDTIQIDSLEDFALVEQALQNITQPVEGYSSPEKYREKMFLIKDYLQSPEDYVEHERNYSEFQQIIRERITAKANELQSFNTTQKQSYIENQQAQRSQTATNQQIMAQRRSPQPGDAAHALTEAEWQLERQQQFNRELGTGTTQGWQRLHESYERYVAEYQQTHNNIQGDFFTNMRSNHNFNWLPEEPRETERSARGLAYQEVTGITGLAIDREATRALYGLRTRENLQEVRISRQLQSSESQIRNHELNSPDVPDFLIQQANPGLFNRILSWYMRQVNRIMRYIAPSPIDAHTQNNLRQQLNQFRSVPTNNEMQVQTPEEQLRRTRVLRNVTLQQLDQLHPISTVILGETSLVPANLEREASSCLNEMQYQMMTLHVLNQPTVIEAIRNHTISIQDFESLNEKQIENLGRIALTHQGCIDAIADGRTTIDRLAEMSTDDLRHAVESDNYPRLELR